MLLSRRASDITIQMKAPRDAWLEFVFLISQGLVIRTGTRTLVEDRKQIRTVRRYKTLAALGRPG